MKVLVIDDEAGIRDSLQEFFLDEGFAVDTAADGEAALEKLTTPDEPPSVVILDMMMPKLSGSQVYALMQQDPRLANIPVIVSTSDPTRAPASVLIMRKPINLELLLNAVRGLCHDPHAVT
jgi:DNA-binding response OmpR family regulator